MKHIFNISLAFILFTTLCLAQRTIRVPQDSATIQAAINGAANGDTVLVDEGTYFENLLIRKKIILGSRYLLDRDTSHISRTTIDGSTPTYADSGSCIHIATGTDSTTVVIGFTIQDGKGDRIYDALSQAYWRGGGGINITAGGASILYNIIRNNSYTSADGFAGGGINMWPYDGPMKFWVVENNKIVNNKITCLATSKVGAEGAGAWLTEDGRFNYNTVEGNVASGSNYSFGGGISLGGATGYGNTTIEMSNNIIRANVAQNASALGMFVDPAITAIPHVTLSNNLIVEHTRTGGTAVYMTSGYYTFINNTIANNQVAVAVALNTARGPLQVCLLNNIIWNPSSWADINSLDYATAQYNCIRGGHPGVGNFSADPLFVPGDPFYHLTDSSFCIARAADFAQFSGAWYNAPKNDLFNTARPSPSGTAGDLGAVESPTGTQRTLPWQPVAIAFLSGGIMRSFIIEYPEKFAGVRNLPVLFSLHGYGGCAMVQKNLIRTHVLGDSVGYITVYPEAYARRWNSGISTNPEYPTPNVDDVAFISGIIDRLYSMFAIDTTRVYSCGMSNGGFMSLRLATQLSSRFAAVASVGGVLTSASAAYTPSRRVPVMLIHGTADDVVPYNGGMDKWYSVDSTLNFWIQTNLCDLPADTIYIADRDPNDHSTVNCYVYKSTKCCEQVKRYDVISGGHQWPGSPGGGSGTINYDIDANVEIWDFCKQFRITGIKPLRIVPLQYSLSQNYPNPFNPETRIEFSIAQSSIVNLKIFDLLGREMAVLVNEKKPGGRYTVKWDASNMASGVYFYTLNAGKFRETKRMILIK